MKNSNSAAVFHLVGKHAAALPLVAIMTWGRSVPVADVFLPLLSAEAARTFYWRTGFVRSGRRKNFYPATGGREDAIVMTREL